MQPLDPGPNTPERATASIARLRELVDATDGAHVDLSEFFGGWPVKVEATHLDGILAETLGMPALRLELGEASLTVRKQDGGMMAELEVRW